MVIFSDNTNTKLQYEIKNLLHVFCGKNRNVIKKL